MRPFAMTLFVGSAFAAGMLVPLIGLHATEDFESLEALGAIIWGEEEIGSDSSEISDAAAATTAHLNAASDDSGRSFFTFNARSGANIVPVTTNGTAGGVGAEIAETGPSVRSAGFQGATSKKSTHFARPSPAAGDGNSTPNVAAILTKPPSIPPMNASIADIQSLLLSVGFDPGPVDGKFGARTENAIRDFERSVQMPITGKPSPKLYDILSRTAGVPTMPANGAEPVSKLTADVAAVPEAEINRNAPIPLFRTNDTARPQGQ